MRLKKKAQKWRVIFCVGSSFFWHKLAKILAILHQNGYICLIY